MSYILGISAFYHDSAAVLLKNGKIVAAAQEERFTRKKHDAKFPISAVRFCLSEANIRLTDIQYIAFYDKPLLKFERLIETYLAFAPKGISSFLSSMPVWIKEKLFLKSEIQNSLKLLNNNKSINSKLLFTEHHQSHAASAFYASPYDEAAVLCLDGVGEWSTTSLWIGKHNTLTPIWDIKFPHSLGLLYSAFTYYAGFKVNSGEYKLMGLAPYGKPKYVEKIKNHLIDIKDDGSFHLNMDYFDYCTGLRMTNKKFEELMGIAPRHPESNLTQDYMDIARSIQEVTEEIIIKLAKSIKNETGLDNLCLAGGVALNCVANGKLLNQNIFKNIWVQPAAGDAGGALGAAYCVWYDYLKNTRTSRVNDDMKGAYLGPSFSVSETKSILNKYNTVYEEINQEQELLDLISNELSNGKVVAWFQGKMEFGPRALGNRSILGDARNSEMQKNMNLKIKFRESFRPFAPAVIAEDVKKYFEFESVSPYMLMVAEVNKSIQIKTTEDQNNLFGIEKLNVLRSQIPAVTHVDYSARIQTVHKETNQRFYNLLTSFKKLTGTGVLVNTSFNVRGEPIVCTPEDAYRCFMRTSIDILVVENLVFYKNDQPKLDDKTNWKEEFQLD
jgi:carbamoyltransferase